MRHRVAGSHLHRSGDEAKRLRWNLMASLFLHEAITTTEAKMQSLEAALMQNKTVNMFYPTQSQGLEAHVTKPGGDQQPKRWNQIVKSNANMDPWGHKIQYRNPGKHNTQGYDVLSFGPDGVESQDDIGNW